MSDGADGSFGSGESGRPIIFRVASTRPTLASTRYRALMPILGLRALGRTCEITDRHPDEAQLRACACLVFVKAFRLSDLHLALKASALRLPIVLDICDNIFVEGYGDGQGPALVAVFETMAKLASAVVTTGPALTGAVRSHVPPSLPVVEIPDQVETREILREVLTVVPLVVAPDASGERLLRVPGVLRLAQKAPSAVRSAVKRGLVQAASGVRTLHALSRTGRARSKAILRSKTYMRARFALQLLRSPRRLAREVARRSAGRPLPPDPRPEAAPAPAGPKEVLWFGNHGATYGDFGMLTLLPLLPDLLEVAKEHAFVLHIVSNSREKFDRFFASLPIATRYSEWDPVGIFDRIEAAHVCLLPNSRDPFSRCKSANRALMALQCGTPVVSSDYPAMADLRTCVILDDWAKGVTTYLTEPDRTRADVEAGRRIISERYSAQAVAWLWDRLLDDVAQGAHPKPGRARRRVLFVLDRAEGAAQVLPFLLNASKHPQIEVMVWMPSELIVEQPEVMRALRDAGVTITFGRRDGPFHESRSWRDVEIVVAGGRLGGQAAKILHVVESNGARRAAVPAATSCPADLGWLFEDPSWGEDGASSRAEAVCP